MNRRLQKGWIISMIVVLGLTTTLPSVNLVFAATVDETQNSEAEAPALPYDDLVEMSTAKEEMTTITSSADMSSEEYDSDVDVPSEENSAAQDTDTSSINEEYETEEEDAQPLNDDTESIVPSSGTNLLQNPTFNYNRLTSGGTINNWQMTGTTTPVNQLTRDITFQGVSGTWINTSDSRFVVGFNSISTSIFNVSNQNNNGTMILSQTINTTPGVSYTISGDFSSNSGTTTFTMTAYNGNYAVAGSGELVTSSFSITNSSSMHSWQNRSTTFTATGTQTTIGYRFAGGAAPQGSLMNPVVTATNVNRTLALAATPTAGGTPTASSYSLPAGGTTTISANPNRGYRFVRWETVSGGGSIANTTAENTTFTMGSANVTIQAVYEQTWNLQLQASPVEGGSPQATSITLAAGESTEISARPNSGYRFLRWEVPFGSASVADTTAENTTVVNGSGSSVVRAIYEEIPVTYTLQLQASPTAGGSPQATSTTLVQGRSTAISANPNSGYRFLRWETVSGGGSIANTTAENTTFTMASANATIRAVYELIPVTYTLQLQASPTAGGSPQATSTTLVQGASTAISARPNSGYRFLRWETVSGGGSIANTTAENTTFVMGSVNATIRAVYELIPVTYTLQLQASPTAGGSPQATSTTLVQGASTAISARPNSGYRFVRWETVSGGGSIANTTAENTTFVMGSANATIRAVYEQIPASYTLQLQASPTTGGSPEATSTTLIQGASTTISANANSGYRFVRWEIVSGGGSIANTTAENTTFVMGSANATVRAVYEAYSTNFDVVMAALPYIAGNPTSSSYSISPGETISISANPNRGWRLSLWLTMGDSEHPGTGTFEDIHAENTTFTMDADNNAKVGIYALYEQDQTYSLKLEASPIEGGNPEADAVDLFQGDTTTISANPNNGFRFVEWKILSGEGQISDKDAENTEFTMDSANTVLQAVYEAEQPSVVNPLDPLDPEIEVNPENRPELPEDQGLLSVDFISQFDFGKHTISVQEKNYYAKPQRLLDDNGTLIEGEERPNYVQISDRRSPADRIGWQLSVTQDKQFENEQGNELTGAEIQFKNQQLVSPQNGKAPGLEQPNMVSLVPGEKQALLTAQEDSGTGTWIYRFGDADSASESVSLTIPSGTVPQASAYNTTFVWELSSVPENNGH